MRRQINFNALTKQIMEQYNEANYNPLDDFCKLSENLLKYTDLKPDSIEEYHLARMIKSLLGIAGKQNIDLNKYFPLFVEIPDN